ncbi:DUF6968 family protein [Pseudomonas sp. NPDC079086]|uniref:DUF6968 family protein n=1 Tax=unclassified Pseudomonas TaxID=196821 RepID=UPI0037CA690C
MACYNNSGTLFCAARQAKAVGRICKLPAFFNALKNKGLHPSANTMLSSMYVAKHPDGRQVVITITVGMPEPDPKSLGGDYRCQVEIWGLGLSTYAHGVDALQALCLAPRCLRHLIEPLSASGWRFYFPGHLDWPIDFSTTGYF